MLLPTKGLSADRALLTVAADVTLLLQVPRSVSELWETYQRGSSNSGRITFDWFVLALTTLFMIGVIEVGDHDTIKLSHVSS
jgi:hypothetical protein